ncbi:MAG: primosomal protein N' [Pseudomonadota bacterium]
MSNNTKYIDVAVDLPVYSIFTYIVPEGIHDVFLPGKRVTVPFGQRNITGYVLSESKHTSEYDDKEIKPIRDVIDKTSLFPPSMVPFLKWIADYYIYPIGAVIKTALPGGLNSYEIIKYSITAAGKEVLDANRIFALDKRVLSLLETCPFSIKGLCGKLNENISASLLFSMEKRGWIVREKEIKPGKTKARLESYVCLSGGGLPDSKLSLSRKKVIDCLKTYGELSLKRLKEYVPNAARVVKALESDGYLILSKKPVYRDPFGEEISPDIAPVPTHEQESVISNVINFLGKGFSPFLLSGVTGSGKTEVYMKLASAAIDKGYSVLVLVPEIALISQIEKRFRARFGECVAILHSGLSSGEKYDQWSRITDKKTLIAIGARSAVFAPLTNIGLIVVDEEHDSSYKQEGGLRYNARDLAVVRAKLENCIVLLGSATPSVQSYQNVLSNKFSGLSLTKRIENRTLPEVNVVDLKNNRNSRGMRRYFSQELIDGIKSTLSRKEQVLLFLNRRGFAGFPVCSACGEAVKCKNCDISLTLHKSANAYKCHYCGYTKAANSKCAKCGSAAIKLLGLGTEKIEEAVKTLFPQARVARMDSDTTIRKGSVLKILKDLSEHNIDILIGTQMVAKGHDYPGITLVGIICADLSLSFPDFRACERTFGLLAQVSGRAGRGDSKGSVILQTYNPDHFTILSAKKQDFISFYEKEIVFRKDLNYPPFSKMIMIRLSGKDKKRTQECAKTLGKHCNELKNGNKSFEKSVIVLGPVEASVAKVADRYRWQILLKGYSFNPLHRFAKIIVLETASKICGKDVSVVIDVDPYFMM